MIRENWGIEVWKQTQIQDFVWDINGTKILKEYNNVEEGTRAVKLMKLLLREQIPVAPIVETLQNEDYVLRDGNLYLLTERLPGKQVTDCSLDSLLFLKMGKVIANLHIALQKVQQEIAFPDYSLLSDMEGWIRDTLKKDAWKHVTKEEFELTLKNLEMRYQELPKQLIHRDVHFGNFLFDQGDFSGYIDFDLSQCNIRIFDICYFLAGLLSKEINFQMTNEQWLCAVHDVLKGYGQISRLSSEEEFAIPYVMEAIELLFTAWFLQQHKEDCARDAVDIYHKIMKCYTNLK